MIQQLLFDFTFLFGVIAILTYTKMFDKRIGGFFNIIYWKEENDFFKWLDVLILIFSLLYQINYWLYK